jgi:hypothetical protein
MVLFSFVDAWHSIRYMHHIFFNCSSLGGHLSGFYFLTTVNYAAIIMGLQIPLLHSDFISSAYFPKSRIVGLYCSLSFEKLLCYFP